VRRAELRLERLDLEPQTAAGDEQAVGEHPEQEGEGPANRQEYGQSDASALGASRESDERRRPLSSGAYGW
jgi:hypothetical protein